MRCLLTEKAFVRHIPGQKPRHYRAGEVIEWLWEEPPAGEKGDNSKGTRARPPFLKPIEGLKELPPEAINDDGQSWRLKVAAAVRRLDRGNDEHWTADGLPRVDAVIEFLGEEVSRDEIKVFVPEARRDE